MPDPCPAECLQPENCLYYRLFERDRLDPRGHGRNIPKALTIDPPLPGQLEQIALGAAVQPPYRLSHIGNGIPILENDHEIVLETGAVFAVQFTLFGRERTSLPALLRALSRRNLRVGKGLFALRAAFDCTARTCAWPARSSSNPGLSLNVKPCPCSSR
jgi:hypothetical protein